MDELLNFKRMENDKGRGGDLGQRNDSRGGLIWNRGQGNIVGALLDVEFMGGSGG